MGLSLRPFKKALDFGSRVYDQVNTLDNGRSYKTRTPTYTASVANQYRDIFDSNSKRDQQRRVQATKIPYRIPQNYRDEQQMRGNARPYENLGSQIVGNTARFLNTAAYAINAGEETKRGFIADLTNNEEALRASLDRQRNLREFAGQADSGLLGAGTIYDNPNEMMNLGNAEIAKRVGLNTLGTGSEVIPWARVTRPVMVGSKLTGNTLLAGGRTIGLGSKSGRVLNAFSAAERGAAGLPTRMAANAAIDVPTSAGESIARQYVQTGKIDPTQVGIDTLTGTAIGQVQPLGSAGFKKLGNTRIVNKVADAQEAYLDNASKAAAKVDADIDAQIFDVNTRKKTAFVNNKAEFNRLVKLEKELINKKKQGGFLDLSGGKDPEITPGAQISDLTDAELYKQINDLKKTVGTQDFDRKLSNALQEELTVRQTGAETRLEAQSRAAGLTRGSEPEVEMPQVGKTDTQLEIDRLQKIVDNPSSKNVTAGAYSQAERDLYNLKNNSTPAASIETKADLDLQKRVFATEDEMNGSSAYSQATGRDGTKLTPIIKRGATEEDLLDALIELKQTPLSERSVAQSQRIKNVEEALKDIRTKTPVETKPTVKLKDIPEESVTGKELADRYQAMKNAGMDDADIEAELSNLKVTDEGPVKQLPNNNAPTARPKVQEFTMPERQARPVMGADGQPTKLGSLAETFYEGKQGNQNIKFAELDMLGKEVTRQIDDEYRAAGTTFSDVARKVQEAANNGVKTLEDAGLTPAEADILRRAQKEMNFVRRKASLGGKQVSEGDLGEMYIPRQFEGEYDGNNLLKGFLDKKPGSEFKRTGAMALEDIDNDASVIGEYVTRYSDTKLYQEERIMKAMEKNNPQAPRENVVDASKKLIDLQNRINDLETTIGLGGLGRKKSLSGGKRIDTAAEMSDIGRSIGKQQIEITETPSGLTNGDRVNSIEIHNGQTVADYIGLNQYRDADSFAPSQVARANGDRTALSEMTYERLTKDYNIPEENARAMADSVGRMNPSLPKEVVIGRLASTYKMAAKQQILEQLQTVNIKNKTLRKDISDLTNQMLREGTIEQKLSAQIVKKTLTTTNAIFRKFNVSTAINELSDVSGMFNIYGKKMAGIPDFKLAKEFGLGDLDPAIQPYIKATQEGKSLKSVLSSINSATNLYHYVEAYKAAVMAHSAKNFYKNLEGDALVKQVLKDYRDVALPVDEFTKTFLDNAPLYTQYMSWAARNMQKEGRFMLGKIDSGVMADKAVSQRIARNLYANLPAKTVFWLASNALKGTAILTAFGLNDFTGLTEQDYSGIAEEDKSAFDRTTKITNRSTVLSLLNSAVQSWEKEQLKNDPKYQTPGEYNPYENNDLDQQIMALFTPSPVKNVFGTPDVDDGKLSFKGGAENLRKTGYAENKGGRVQYEAPDTAYDWFKAYVFGPNATDNARKYSGNTDVSTRIRSGDNPLTAVKDMASEQLNIQDRNYNRPLTKDYTEAYKAINEELKTATLDGGRKYNNTLDDMKKNDPTNYNTYISSMDGDHVSPEFWREITGGAASKDGDITIFNSLKERKKQLFEDMTRAGKNGDGKYNVDPLYDLPENQARMVLQQKATATGDDLSLRNTLYKEAWYKDYMKKQAEFYKNKPAGDEKEFKETERVKQWNAYNDTYNTLTGTIGDTLQKEFPLVYQLKQYEYGTEASKAFLNANYDAWKAQSDALDARKLDVINKMREIEGFPPMSIEAYQQATEVADTSGTKDSKWGSGGGSKVKSAGSYAVNTKISGASNPKVSVKAPKIGKFKVAGINAGSKPKVSMKKSLV